MWVAFDLKHPRFRGDQFGLSSLAQGDNTQNGFGFDDNPKLGLGVKRALHAAHVKVDPHIENVPASFQSSGEPSEERLTNQGERRAAFWRVRSSGWLGHNQA
jgi:hypothetical protein